MSRARHRAKRKRRPKRRVFEVQAFRADAYQLEIKGSRAYPFVPAEDCTEEMLEGVERKIRQVFGISKGEPIILKIEVVD